MSGVYLSPPVFGGKNVLPRGRKNLFQRGVGRLPKGAHKGPPTHRGPQKIPAPYKWAWGETKLGVALGVQRVKTPERGPHFLWGDNTPPPPSEVFLGSPILVCGVCGGVYLEGVSSVCKKPRGFCFCKGFPTEGFFVGCPLPS